MQITYNLPRRLTSLQFLHIFFNDAFTFIMTDVQYTLLDRIFKELNWPIKEYSLLLLICFRLPIS
jgi:hypothetical protein